MATTYTVAADFSYANIQPSQLIEAGYKIALRYLGNDGRCIDIPERDALFAAGIRIGYIGQRGSVSRPRSGYNGGREDGEFFQREADEQDMPDHKPILCAVADVGDGFPTPRDIPAIKEYFRGIVDTNRRPIGIYGPYWVLEEFRGDPRVFCFWQTAGGSGSGQGTGGSIHNAGDNSWRRLSSLACMYQEYGDLRVPGTDHNEVLEPHWTRWTTHPHDNDHFPEGGDDNDTEEDDMPATIHLWTSSKNNRSWLENVPGFQVPSDADGGWDHPWAGLAVWEATEGQPQIRQISNQTVDLYKAIMYIQAVNGEKPTIVDDGFMETKWFESKTWMPGDYLYDGPDYDHDMSHHGTDPVVTDIVTTTTITERPAK